MNNGFDTYAIKAMPPLIYSDNNISVSQNILLSSNDIPIISINGNIITDNVATLSNGILSNLITVSTSSEYNSYAVTKEYIDNKYIKGPGGINGSVQYNNFGSFGGYSNILYSETTNGGTLSVSSNITIVSNLTSLIGSNINNIISPVSNNQAANKMYTDLSTQKKVNTINSTNSQTYLPGQIINGIILRNGLTIIPTTNPDISINNIDYFPSAVDIYSYLENNNFNTNIGSSFSFNLFNYNNNNAPLVLFPSLSDNLTNFVSFSNNNLVIYDNYQLTTLIILLSGKPNIKFSVFIKSCSFINNISFISPGYNDPQWALQYYLDNSTKINRARTNTQCILPMNPTSYPSSTSVTYSYTDIMAKLIIRGKSLTQNVTDTFETASVLYKNSFLNGVTNMSVEMAIQNIDPTYTITITSGSDWTYFSQIINPGQTLLINILFTNNSCSIFKIGLFTRNG